jgi:hypothetical protein
MVSVLEGQLTRTWTFTINDTGKKHTINLYHDTITGVRSAMLDFEEIAESIGNSSVFMGSEGHQINFTVEGFAACIEIRKAGWTEFAYSCSVNGQSLKESTQMVAQRQGEQVFRVAINETALTKTETGDEFITWYLVSTTRVVDNISTFVHRYEAPDEHFSVLIVFRRFRDFADLNSQVKQNFKGHHLRSSLPPFPEKTPKFATDHLDPTFIQERRQKLLFYLRLLLDVPHVAEMTCVKSFLGLMEQVPSLSVISRCEPHRSRKSAMSSGCPRSAWDLSHPTRLALSGPQSCRKWSPANTAPGWRWGT